MIDYANLAFTLSSMCFSKVFSVAFGFKNFKGRNFKDEGYQVTFSNN